MSTSNLGGLCGLSCKTDQSNYDTATGVCAYTDTSNPKCDQGAAHEMYFRGLGTTQSGSQVDLRVTNLTEYIPWDSNQNGLSGAWGQISLLANHPTEFLFEFIDTVHARYYLLTARHYLLTPQPPFRVTELATAPQCHLPPHSSRCTTLDKAAFCLPLPLIAAPLSANRPSLSQPPLPALQVTGEPVTVDELGARRALS